jgi:hypothetical protein
LRKFTIDRWNWSQKAEKWVYVTSEGGKRKYIYQVEPPQEFIDLTMEMKKLSDKQAKTTDPEENMRLFKELMDISKRMQAMRQEE